MAHISILLKYCHIFSIHVCNARLCVNKLTTFQYKHENFIGKNKQSVKFVWQKKLCVRVDGSILHNKHTSNTALKNDIKYCCDDFGRGEVITRAWVPYIQPSCKESLAIVRQWEIDQCSRKIRNLINIFLTLSRSKYDLSKKKLKWYWWLNIWILITIYCWDCCVPPLQKYSWSCS